jgi:hypothetical protein
VKSTARLATVIVAAQPDGSYRMTMTSVVAPAALGPALLECRPASVVFSFEPTAAAEAEAVSQPSVTPAEADLGQGPAHARLAQDGLDNRGRMPLLPFLVQIRKDGGMGWASRAEVAHLSMKFGWQTRGQTPAVTAGRVLQRLVDEGADWVRRQVDPADGVVKYAILPREPP